MLSMYMACIDEAPLSNTSIIDSSSEDSVRDVQTDWGAEIPVVLSSTAVGRVERPLPPTYYGTDVCAGTMI